MKTINYTGSSKLISRIVNLLNRKVPLPLDGDGNPDWGSNGQVLSTNGVDEAVWVNAGGGGSGGHTIEDTSGADLPQEDNLQFVGVYTEDDSANNRTKVNIVRQMTKAAMEALSSAEQEGFIDTTDEDDDYIPISAEDVKRGVSDVDADLTALENGKVNRSGDTMTGMLTVDRSADDGTQRCLALRSGTSGITYLTLFDKTNTQLGSFGCNAQNNPVFRTSGGTVKKISTRTVTTLVDETANIAAGGNKTYATLTASALSAYDEIWIYAEYGNVANNGSASKAQIAAAASYGGGAGATINFLGYVLESSGTIAITYAFGIKPISTGLTVYNRSVSSTIGKLLIEGITY